jgi:hypothetical protein
MSIQAEEKGLVVRFRPSLQVGRDISLIPIGHKFILVPVAHVGKDSASVLQCFSAIACEDRISTVESTPHDGMHVTKLLSRRDPERGPTLHIGKLPRDLRDAPHCMNDQRLPSKYFVPMVR